MNFTLKEVEEYALEHTTKADATLELLERETNSKVLIPRMLSGNLQGQTLTMLSKMMQPENILEIGTYTGYSAICLAKGLKENGKLHTVDINDELNEMVASFIEQSGMSKSIVMHTGHAKNVIPTLDFVWDLVFLDADKANYINYYHQIFPNLRKGGIIIADNVLWSGKVCLEDQDIASNDKDTKALKLFNTFIQNDERVENVLLPIRDGLMIIRKK